MYTTIYEKELNLYLYLPPHSCHAPGMLKGLIFGFVHRAHALCMRHSDKLPFLIKCYYRLLARGHKSTVIRPLFNEAIEKILYPQQATARYPDQSDHDKPLLLHLCYNPLNPTSSQLQQVFRQTILSPVKQPHVTDLQTYNAFGGSPDFDRCVLCYSKQRTLGNILAPRKHRFGTNFDVREFLCNLQGN